MHLLPRRLPHLTALLATLLVAVPTLADDTGTSVVEDLKNTAKPLIKALSLLGTPYKFGGSNPEKGVDCSGFVKHVYKESAGVALSRSAQEMSKRGEAVARSELKPGDLVFFNTRKRPNSHVGIYKGDGEFVHAASSRSKKVMVSRMDQAYWASRFDGARRVLPVE